MKEKRTIILAVVLLALVGVYVWHAQRMEGQRTSAGGKPTVLTPAAEFMGKMNGAVIKYKKDKGDYPQKLEDLKGKYLDDATYQKALDQKVQYVYVSKDAYRLTIPASPVQVAAKPQAPGQPAPAGQQPEAPTAAPSAVASGPAPTSLADIVATYDPRGKADPFKPFLLTQKASAEGSGEAKRKPLTPLQKMALSEIQAGLRAIIWGKMGNKALVEDATGKGYVLTVGTYVGQNDGIVKKILEDRIVVEEYIRDPVENRLTTNEVILKLKKVETEE
ncbi:MAG TPA: pilus assembly protein PilP [Syntrophobacteria bacterium]|nr:pilus assembly protein PilP [Syntrophobacteria bacterium]